VTEGGGHRPRTRRRGRLSGVPLDEFTAALLGLMCAAVQETAGVDDVRRTGHGVVTVTVNVHNHDFAGAAVRVDTVRKPENG
jgi:hypothetical protein